MNYRYETHSNKGNVTEVAASVLEIQTGHYVATNIPVVEAKKMIRHLNFGGGFDGWTPSFFLNKLELSVKEEGLEEPAVLES